MTTSNAITLEHILANFDLFGTPGQIEISPTATGGAGINNEAQFSHRFSSKHLEKRSGTDYVKKYLDKEKNAQLSRGNVNCISAISTASLATLADVDDASTICGVSALTELDDEATQNIYSTYFNNSRSYNTDLTITNYREEILQQLSINPVVIIQGPTGCGKTTQVPQYILDFHQSRGTPCNIIVTQPRKIAAISIARRVCQERKWQLGTIVGYQVAMDPKVSLDTRLTYVTTGVLLEKLVNAKRMDKYTHIIIDEVHERNQDTDFALLLVKKFLTTNSQTVKVVLMSATFDSSVFAKYFAFSPNDEAPIVEIIGKSKDVSEHYITELKTLIQRIPRFDLCSPGIDPCLYDGVLNLMFIFDKIEKVEQGAPAGAEYAPKRGAVLIFLPGYEEICALSNKLKTQSLQRNFWIIPLHSTITIEEQTKVFRDAPGDQRKIILSTNIAESSITVPDVKYVIDFCLTKNLVTDAATNYTCLQLEWASKANCIQRKGRAGRVDIGKVYRMVDRNFYDQLPEYGIPEIKRCPLTKTILHIKKLNLCEPLEMLAFALDPPDQLDIETAILHLKEGLALTSMEGYRYDGDLTFIGRIMAALPLDIKLTKLIIFGYVFHCLEECIIIAASLSLQSFFSKPFNRHLEAYRSRRTWTERTYSDCLAHLIAYDTWKLNSLQGRFLKPGGQTEEQWAQSSFIQLRRIKEVDLLVKEIKKRLEKMQIFVDKRQFTEDEKSNTLILKMIIAGAFFPHYFLQEEVDEEKVNRDLNGNDPLSTVVVNHLPKHGILYASALKDMFICCGQEKINIEFEEGKAYLQFQRNKEPKNSVLDPVYLAIKMKKLRMPLELSVFSEEEAERMFKQLMASKCKDDKSRFVSNRVTVKFAQESNIKRIPLPSIDKTVVFIIVTHVIDCGHFWARYITREYDQRLMFIETTINSQSGRNLQPLRNRPQLNQLYLAPFFEGNEALYYRVELLEIIEDTATVFFVDYGNVTSVKLHELRDIDDNTPDIRSTPAFAFECYLAEVKPSSIKSKSGDWCQAANLWFKQTVSGFRLEAKIYSVVQNTVRLYLMTHTRDGAALNINKKLIELRFAEPAEESLLSKQNNEIRMKCYDYDSNVSEDYSRDIEVSWNEASECGNLSKTNKKIFLQGPFNPLEVSYSGLTKLDRPKSVKIDRDSVNSVSFNAEPTDPYTSMLVAAHVGVGRANNELTLRSTTLMPKLRGLPSLICLLFSPYAEIRTDKANKSYTGALCGLGYDAKEDRSIYEDHDLEITFDIELSLEDIANINKIRMGFNILLSSNSDTLEYPRNAVTLIFEQTRTHVLKLLQQKRTPKEPEYFRNAYKWNQNKGITLEPDISSNADCAFVLPLHRPPGLVELPPPKFNAAKRKEIKRELDNLYKLTDLPQLTEIKQCTLCSCDIASKRDLVCHLNSDKHLQKEEKFRQGAI